MVLGHIYIVKPCRIHAKQTHRPPDSGVREAGTPVPAIHAVSLSQVGAATHGIGTSHNQRILFIQVINIVHRGGDPDRQLVSFFL